MSETLSAAFNALYGGSAPEQQCRARAAFVGLLGVMNDESNGAISGAFETCDSPWCSVLGQDHNKPNGTMLVLEIGAREGGQDRDLTLRFTHNDIPVLAATQRKSRWDEARREVAFPGGALEDLLTLSAAMAGAKASFDPEAARDQPNNPMLRKKKASSLGEALATEFTRIRAEKGAHAYQILECILENLDCAENGGIQEAFRAYDRLSVFSYTDGDISIGLQIGPRGKQDVPQGKQEAPRTILLSVHRQGVPILEVSRMKCVWNESFSDEGIPIFHTGALQTLLDLRRSLNNPEALSKASMQEAPKTLALA